MRSFIRLTAVILWLVVAALFITALGVFACAEGRVGDTCPPDIIALPLALGAIIGFFVAVWLWGVYNR